MILFRLQEINSQVMRDLAQVKAECNQLNDDTNAHLLEMEGLRTDFTRESEAMKAEISLKDNIINEYETVLLHLSCDISHFSRRNSNSG